MNPAKWKYEEPQEQNLTVFDKGEYPWKVIEVNRMERSKNGNDMLPVKLEFSDGDGNTTTFYEYLVFSEKSAWKVNQFIKSASGGVVDPGRVINFEHADTIRWIKSARGTAKLIVEDVPGKTYKRNKVEAFTYPASGGGKSAAPPVENDEPVNDEIPF